jgi:transcriptional regulator with XRE-family HTH domain
MLISRNIVKLRERHELSKEEFCKVIGVSRRTLDRWESGARVPTLKYVRVIVDKFYIENLYTFMFGRRYEYRRLNSIKKMIPMIIIMLSCNSTPELESKPTDHRLYGSDAPLRVVRIEDCEYFVGSSGYGSVFTHKGNCSNPIHTKLLK